ncbi:MAG TPA: heparinase II/III family protein [Candidatus Krumholzibacteria bacterium]|nr:heparinase II/III family protein [Candidatus Krumholzibacteria bacterium]
MRRALRYVLALAVPALLTSSPSSAQPVLTDSLYLAHHPRVLFTPAELPVLRARIHDGGRDDEAYTYVRNYVQNIYSVLPPTTVLGPYFGLDAMPNLGLVAHLELPPNTAAMAQGKLLTLYLVNTYEPDYDEANSGLRLRSLALGYDLFFADATEAERALVRDEMVRYIEPMIGTTAYESFEYRPYLGNHSAMFGAALGLAAISLQGEAEAEQLAAALAMADRIAENLLTYQFDPGGAYNEGVLYALWTLRNLVYYFDARERFDGYSYADHATVRAVEQWLPYELLPEGGGYSHNLNDSPYLTTPFSRSTTYVDWATSKWNSGLAAWLWEHSAGTYGTDVGIMADKAGTILWHTNVPPIQPDDILPLHRVWVQRGLYHFRTGWQTTKTTIDDVVFTFHSGKFQGGHAQEDQNTFALYAYGAKFAIDHGAGGLGKESEAHNLVLVDGLGQHNAGSSIGTDGRIAEYLLGGSADYVVGDATQAYATYSEFNAPGVPFPGVDWSWGYSGANPVQHAFRRVLVVHGEASSPYIVVMDDIDKDGAPHLYQWRMHTHFGNTVNTAASPWTIEGAGAAMDVHLLHPSAESATVTTSAFENGNTDPNSTILRVTHTAIDPRFALMLVPRRGGSPSPAVTREPYPWGYACSVDWGGGVVDRLVRNDAGAAVAHENIETDALVAWVREENGVVAAYLAAGARSLVVGTNALVTVFDGPVTCEMSGSTIHIDRADAVFRFFDSGIAEVLCREQPVEFVLVGGYLVTAAATPVPNVPPPTAWTLAAHPNPFNSRTTLTYTVPADGPVTVAVFDARGARVATLVHREFRRTGDHRVEWDGRTDGNRSAASGVYFARVEQNGAYRASKMVLLK